MEEYAKQLPMGCDEIVRCIVLRINGSCTKQCPRFGRPGCDFGSPVDDIVKAATEILNKQIAQSVIHEFERAAKNERNETEV